MSIHITLLSYR